MNAFPDDASLKFANYGTMLTNVHPVASQIVGFSNFTRQLEFRWLRGEVTQPLEAVEWIFIWKEMLTLACLSHTCAIKSEPDDKLRITP